MSKILDLMCSCYFWWQPPAMEKLTLGIHSKTSDSQNQKSFFNMHQLQGNFNGCCNWPCDKLLISSLKWGHVHTGVFRETETHTLYICSPEAKQPKWPHLFQNCRLKAGSLTHTDMLVRGTLCHITTFFFWGFPCRSGLENKNLSYCSLLGILW